MGTKMKLHNGVYYSPNDLKEQLKREKAEAEAKKAAEAVASVAEAGTLGEAGEKIAALEVQVKNLTELLDSIISAFGERLEALEQPEGDPRSAAEPEPEHVKEPEPAKAKASTAKKAVK